MFEKPQVIVADDDFFTLKNIELLLHDGGFNSITLCRNGKEAVDALASVTSAVVVSDINMPFITGEELLMHVREHHPHIPVIIVTGMNDVATAVRCVHLGAADYLVKPIDRDRLIGAVESLSSVLRANSGSKPNSNRKKEFAAIITEDAKMLSVFRYMEAIKDSKEPVLITGETGVGKDLIAHAVHDLGHARGEFVAVNVAGLDDHMFTDTLFGHAKGAFTGAEAPRAGLIEKAKHGTLFLDEIGELSPASQIKLLELLQHGRYYPLGSDEVRTAQTRIVLATNRDLTALGKSGSFRKDLYYRLSVHHIAVPPLRERKDDIAPLADHFILEAAEKMGKRAPSVPRELYTLLASYRFPGNVRELRGMVYNAVSQCTSRIISLQHIREHIMRHRSPDEFEPQHAEQAAPRNAVSLKALFGYLPTIDELEARLIDEAMAEADNNQSMAAQFIGITRQTLIRKLKERKTVS